MGAESQRGLWPNNYRWQTSSRFSSTSQHQRFLFLDGSAGSGCLPQYEYYNKNVLVCRLQCFIQSRRKVIKASSHCKDMSSFLNPFHPLLHSSHLVISVGNTFQAVFSLSNSSYSCPGWTLRISVIFDVKLNATMTGTNYTLILSFANWNTSVIVQSSNVGDVNAAVFQDLLQLILSQYAPPSKEIMFPTPNGRNLGIWWTF